MKSYCCDLCGSNRSIRVGWHGRFGSRVFTVICLHCGLICENQQLSEEELSAYYGHTYHKTYSRCESPDGTTELECSWQRKAQERLGFLLAHCDSLKDKKVLEVGCVTGSFLKEVRNIGGKAWGVEPSIEHARFAKEQWELNVLCGTLEDFKEQELEHPFDVIALFHVLEHLPSPSLALRYFYSILREDGLLYLEVPNTLTRARFKQRLDTFLRPVHLYNFTPRSLGAFLACHGFEVIATDDSVSTRLRWIARKGRGLSGRFDFGPSLVVGLLF